MDPLSNVQNIQIDNSSVLQFTTRELKHGAKLEDAGEPR